jgi:hypothetical protein
MGKVFDKLFDWTPIAVEKPVEVMDKNGNVKGYQVVITYVHQGKRSKFFGNECQAWYHLYGSPQNAANAVYRRYHASALKWQHKAKQLFR